MQHIPHGISETRPWGAFCTPAFLPGIGACKLLYVAPGSRLSLQRHTFRIEHWIVLSGQIQAIVGQRSTLVERGEHIVVQAGEWHRIQNPNDREWATVAEIQVGISGSPREAEEDIERLEDDFGRVTKVDPPALPDGICPKSSVEALCEDC